MNKDLVYSMQHKVSFQVTVSPNKSFFFPNANYE